MFRILRGLGSRALPCGCLVGVYETYAAKTMAVIDAKGAQCANHAHSVDASIDYDSVMSRELYPPSTIPTVNR